MRNLVVVLILAALGAGGWYGYQQWQRPDSEAKYKTAEVRRGKLVQTVTATGAIEPLVKVLVGSEVSGTVRRWFADFNQQVEEGFVLAELDQTRFRAAIEQRTAAVAVARARAEESAAMLATATLERQRIEVAFDKQVASNFELESAKASEQAAAASLHAAEAQVLSAEAELRQSKTDLDKTIIRAPIDGVVISRDIDAGQTVAATMSAPTLFTIANDLKKMQVNAAVSETDVGKIREGTAAEFRVDAYPDRRFRGKVTQVRFKETVVDNVVTYTTLIDVDNSELLLRPGMTATVMFEVARVDDALQVPNAALRFNPSVNNNDLNWNRPGRGQKLQPRVFKLAADNQLTEVPVELGLNDGSFTQITSDKLQPGDHIVVELEAGRGGGAPRFSGPPRMPRM
ncbi:Macrolide export protein MacA [Phycisphaerae bacterium RAS1]|nr:Macrolide export protein MacA [Phycisphaerae bacterium RAS1]